MCVSDRPSVGGLGCCELGKAQRGCNSSTLVFATRKIVMDATPGSHCRVM